MTEGRYTIPEIVKEGIELYSTGEYDEAFALLMQEPGDKYAQYYIGMMYEYGTGAEQSDEKAAEWYRKAVDKRLPEAMRALAVFYAEGRGVEQDLKTAKMLRSVSNIARRPDDERL